LSPGYDQTVVAEESDPVTGGTNTDLWDMNTQNEFGKDAGRYLYRTHETNSAGQVTVTDLKTGETKRLAQRPDWERFDGIVWTPWGTILAAEETNAASQPDPNVPQSQAGLVYELFVDRKDPSRLDPSRERITPNDGTTDTVQDGIRARPALGSKSHEGMRFDKRGYHYGISEVAPGGVFRFVPDRKGELAEGTLSVYKSANGQDGQGTWVPIPDAQAESNAQSAANGLQGNGYSRPEDVETGESTGHDPNNGGNTVYVAITGTDDVLAIDLSSKERPFGYFYVNNQPRPTSPTPNASAEFDAPDNLALDRDGNLAISEDPPGNAVGADVWIAAPPRGNDDNEDDAGRHQPASTVQRFASLKDCVGEPTGIYFAVEETEEYAEDNPTLVEPELVNGETLFVNRQHAGQTSPVDQLVAIAPVDADDDDDDDDEDDDD